MNVQELIDALQKIEDKNQLVVMCVKGVEINETEVTGIVEESDVGVVWLKIPEQSSVHDSHSFG